MYDNSVPLEKFIFFVFFPLEKFKTHYLYYEMILQL